MSEPIIECTELAELKAAPDPTNFGDEIRRRLDADPALRDELSIMRSFQEPDTDGEIQHLRATITQLEADVQRWMEVAITQQPKIARLEAECEDQKCRRVYYQEVVYDVCNLLDTVYTPPTISGTVNSPSTAVQDRVQLLIDYRDEQSVKYRQELFIKDEKIARLEAENAELKDQRATLHAHVAEAIELLGADPAKRVLDSWTLREECDSARRKIERLEAELETEKRHWIEDDRDICQMEQERDELKAAHAKLRADVKAWSHEAQERNVGHGWSDTAPIWLAVPMPMFEKLDAIVGE